VLALFIIFSGCEVKDKAQITTKDSVQTTTDVSIIQLISNPEKFDGKYVRLIGFVRLEFEGDAIYLHEDDYKYGLTRNGLWLDVSEDYYRKDRQKFDQKYVLVEGPLAQNIGGT